LGCRFQTSGVVRITSPMSAWWAVVMDRQDDELQGCFPIHSSNMVPCPSLLPTKCVST
jgi:hypothetical protein